MNSARRLLNQVDRLPYGVRQRRLADYARALVGTDELTTVLDELHTQGAYARKVALHLATVGGEMAYVARCLVAAETEVAGQALGLAVRMGLAPDLLVALLPDLSAALRRKLYAGVRRHKAGELAEMLVPAVRARFGDQEVAAILPACGADTVAAELPGLAYAVTGWRMIGHRHTAVFLDWLDAEVAATPSVAWRDLIAATAAGLAAAAPAEPARVLAVLAKVGPRIPLPRELDRVLAVLARHDPARLLDLLADPRRPDRGKPGGRKLWRALLATSDDDLVRFARTPHLGSLATMLRRLPPARREAVYAGVVGNREMSDAIPPAMDRLPLAARAAEAERLLELRGVADDPSRRLAVTARLPWAVAKETLHTATRRPTAAERAEGYTCLVIAAAGSRDHEVFAELLTSLGRLANEQDPVRAAAFTALAEVPPWLFRADMAAAVHNLMTDALAARDCSHQTRTSVLKLITNLVRHGALSRQPDLVETGIAALRGLGGRWPSLNLGGIDRDLPRGGEHQVLEALRPRMVEDERKGRFTVALSLADGLGRRAWEMPELQGFVARARGAKDDATVRMAIRLWLAPWRTRGERLAEVFDADHSTVTIDEVLTGIGRHRTDLVDKVLTAPLHGRFLGRGVTFVPTFDGCFHHWLPRQCAAYAEALTRIADNRGTQVWERVRAVGRLGRVPGTARRLRGYLDDPEVAVVEAALAGLAWTDEPAEVLGDLLAHVDTDRARVAVYAAARCARFVPPARLGEVLAPALHSRKVTSRKEAVRLLAAHHAPGVAGLLHDAFGRPGQHRDLRRAIVSAARWCLHDERASSLLESAAVSEPAVATEVTTPRPATIAPHHRPRYATLVRTVADAADPDAARAGLRSLSGWARWDESATSMLVRRFTDLTNTATWVPAMSALIAAGDALSDPEPLVTAARILVAAPEPASTVDRDLPARQRLMSFVDTLCDDDTGSPTKRAAAARMADALAADRTLRTLAIKLATHAVTFEDVVPLLRLAELADEPSWAWQAHAALNNALWTRVDRLPESRWFGLANALVARPAPAPRLLAVAIVGAAGARLGWSPQWRELLADLRAQDDPDVRLAALNTFTSVE
jgi:hypothetical protein